MAVAVDAAHLSRLSAELWPKEDIAPAPAAGGAAAGFARHAVLATGGTLTIVPIADRAAAAGSMVRWTDATTWRESAMRAAGWVGLRTGLAAPLVRRLVDVRVHSAGGSPPTLHEYLAAAVGVPRVVLSAAFGSPRPNQKPIVRIHAGDGATLGFAKVGWNELTTTLVEREAAFLTSAARRRLRRIRVPEVLHRGTWRDRHIVVAAPLAGPPRWREPQPPGAAVLEEVAALDPILVAPVARSPYGRTVDRRLDALGADAAAAGRDAVAAIEDRWGALELRWGHWHGDWVPWNMRTTRDGVIVWDWERTAGGVPVGFDALHHHFHSRLDAARGGSVAALVMAVRDAGPALAALGVRTDAVPAVAALYALEMHLRFGGGDGGAPGVTWLEGLLAGALRYFAVR
jgi:hypothetical protein